MAPSRIPPDSIFSGRPLARGERVAIALLIAVASGIAAYLAFQRVPEMLARDFTYPWRAARALLDGQDPYAVIRPAGPPPFDMWYMYPLTAAIAVVPLAWLEPTWGGALFVAIGAGLLAFLITRRGMGRMWMFLSVPFAMAVVLGQWTPLLIAGALATPLSWALTCKPTLGAALFVYRPSWRAAAVAVGFVLVAFLVKPTWLPAWIRASSTVAGHSAPVTESWGWVPLLALMRWRKPEARLVAAMSLVPQNLYFYDQLPLWLVATSGRTSLGLTLLSWIAWFGTQARCELGFYCGPEAVSWIIWLTFIPATALVLCDSQSLNAARNGLKRLLR